ncbi:unnamed protein product, partial [Pneumocystis jirovecii]
MSNIDFLGKAISIVKKAIEEDNAQKYNEAYKLYINSLECFNMALKYEKSENGKNLIRDKVTQYLDRAEMLKEYLEKNNGNMKYRSVKINGNELGLGKKMKKDSDSDDNDDIETRKLKSALASTVISESPNVRWDDVAGLDSAKDALKEAVILPARLPHLFKGSRKPWIGY